jgi:glycosyltransferase involved in cell wall biosynthesis
MKPKVSIIVPIYNVEKYLARCLDSLLAQRLKEIEIIAVNDGSTDSSLEIVNIYSAKDNRIRVINQPNKGVSSARNAGISAASGAFVGFVDPDDWIDEEMYITMYNQAIREKVDIVMCSYIREFGSHSKVKKFNLPNLTRYEGEEVKEKLMRRLVGPLNEEISNPELLDAWGTVWSKLYRSEVINDNRVRFVDLNKIGSNEDNLFNIEVFYYAKSFLYLNSPYYHYWRVNSQSISTGYKPDLINRWNYLFNYIESFLKAKNLNQEFYHALNNRICLNTLGLGLNTISKENPSSSFKKITNIKAILTNKRIKHSFKQLEMSRFPIVWRVFYFFAKMRFSVGFYFMLVCIEYLRKIIR